ncbi:unnamed protein product [Closterium sp. NIES-53]
MHVAVHMHSCHPALLHTQRQPQRLVVHILARRPPPHCWKRLPLRLQGTARTPCAAATAAAGAAVAAVACVAAARTRRAAAAAACAAACAAAATAGVTAACESGQELGGDGVVWASIEKAQH